MSSFTYRNSQLYAEDVPLEDIAKQFGTPTYVYSRMHLEQQYLAYTEALGNLPHLVCFAVKANSNLGVLNILARLGAGFDIVSDGELERVLAAGGNPNKIVFSGVGKTRKSLLKALSVGIHCFNVESGEELDRLQSIAQELNSKAAISLRVNPDIDAKTHPYISTGLKENKFGVSFAQAKDLYQHASKLSHIKILGIDCHIGSQLITLEPFAEATERLIQFIDQLKEQNIELTHLNLGGGLGVTYNEEQPPSITEYIQSIREKIHARKLTLIFEPGRSIAANSGILLTRSEYIKRTEHKNFIITDAAMNDLIRPALYQAWMNVRPVAIKSIPLEVYDIVGPICETGDFLAKNRLLALEENDLLAIDSAGAYGFTMSSNYNSRTRAAEVIVDKAQFFEVRKRETFSQLIENESCLPEDD